VGEHLYLIGVGLPSNEKKTYQLTKQAIKRLEETPVLVTTVNGTFKRAQVATSFSRYSVELRVDRSHPTLEWASGVRNNVDLIYWAPNEGYPIDVPKELETLVYNMRAMAIMNEEEANKTDKELRQVVSEFYSL
jgi:hypothetical protein